MKATELLFNLDIFPFRFGIQAREQLRFGVGTTEFVHKTRRLATDQQIFAVTSRENWHRLIAVSDKVGVQSSPRATFYCSALASSAVAVTENISS